MKITYWNIGAETVSRDQLEHEQLEDLRHTVSEALKTPFYKKRLGGIGITSGRDIDSFNDLQKIPFTTKNDLRKAYP